MFTCFSSLSSLVVSFSPSSETFPFAVRVVPSSHVLQVGFGGAAMVVPARPGGRDLPARKRKGASVRAFRIWKLLFVLA